MRFLIHLLVALFGSPAAILDMQPRKVFVDGRLHSLYPTGQLVPVIRGGDGTVTIPDEIRQLSTDELNTRVAELQARLNDPAFDGDVDALILEADQAAAEVANRRSRAERLERARGNLAGAGTLTDPAPGQRPPAQPRSSPVGADSPEVLADLAQRFVESEQFKNFRANGYKGKVGLDLPGIDMRAFTGGREVRAPLDSTATSAGAFQNPSRPAVVPMTNADRPVRLADLIDRQTTGDSTVEYVRDTTGAGGGAAAEVAEGAAKPEAGYTFEVITDSVRTIAHWVQITRQAADDNQQIMGYIRGRLSYGLEFRLDSQIINGNGTAPNLRGILNTSGINTYAPAAAEARVISIRKAITLCQQDEYSPTATVLNPADWELVELSTDNDGMFRVSPNVANALAPRIWGLNVVPTTAIASGTGLVGDFRQGATLWDRMQPQIFITDSHASAFTSNILTLLAELRAALSVWRPSAFAKVTFNGTS